MAATKPDAYSVREPNGSGYKEVPGLVQGGTAAQAGQIIATDGTGHIDPTLLPTGVGAETITGVATAALTAGDFVTLSVGTGSQAGATVVTQASAAATTGTAAQGFVLSAVAAGGTATVYLGGLNTALTGIVPGKSYWLSDSSAGKAMTTRIPASTSALSQTGKIDQLLGIGASTTAVDYRYSLPTTIA